MLILSMCVTALIFADILLSLDFFISKESFMDDKTLLFSKSSQALGPLGFVFAIVFYLRIRLSVDIQNTKIPYMVGSRHLEAAGKKKWVMNNFCLAVAGFVMIFVSDLAPRQIVEHYQMQESLLFVMVAYVLQLICLIYGPLVLVHFSLVLEKVLRFFKSLKDDYASMKSTTLENW